MIAKSDEPHSGTRWQSSGFFAVSKGAKVQYAKAAESADEVPNLGDLAEGLVRKVDGRRGAGAGRAPM